MMLGKVYDFAWRMWHGRWHRCKKGGWQMALCLWLDDKQNDYNRKLQEAYWARRKSDD